MGSLMEANFVRPDSDRWKEVLATVRHDVYHLPDYVEIQAQQEQGTPVAFIAKEEDSTFLLPLILRPVATQRGDIPADLFDAVSHYGYSGPIINHSLTGVDQSFMRRALNSLLILSERHGIASCFVRLHPILTTHLDALAEVGTVIRHGETVTIDLTLPAEELWRQTRSGHRSEINRARRAGHVAEMVDGDDAFEAFEAIYQETMERLGASDYYRFDRMYFQELRDRLCNLLHLGVVRIDGDIAAAALFTEIHGIVQYHLSGVRGEYLRHQPTKLLLDYARSWAKSRGNRVLHLGGGLGGRADSLFAFKAGFSHGRAPFHTWRIITDQEAYSRLTADWERQHGVEADDMQGFFPAYRKPAAGD